MPGHRYTYLCPESVQGFPPHPCTLGGCPYLYLFLRVSTHVGTRPNLGVFGPSLPGPNPHGRMTKDSPCDNRKGILAACTDGTSAFHGACTCRAHLSLHTSCRRGAVSRSDTSHRTAHLSTRNPGGLGTKDDSGDRLVREHPQTGPRKICRPRGLSGPNPGHPHGWAICAPPEPEVYQPRYHAPQITGARRTVGSGVGFDVTT